MNGLGVGETGLAQGPRLTYYETFDSVVVGEAGTPDLTLSMKLELLRGKRIALSVNQAFDSQLIDECLGDPGFRALFVLGKMVVVTRPEVPSVARALEGALRNPGFRFSYRQELDGNLLLRQAALAALAYSNPTRAGSLAPYIDRVLMLDALLALAPRYRNDPQPGGLAKVLARVRAENHDERVQRLLRAGHNNRSDVYRELDRLRNSGLSADEWSRARRLVDACYCLIVAHGMHADTLVVRDDWPSNVTSALLDPPDLKLMQGVAAARGERLYRVLDTDASLSWQAVIDFLERVPVIGDATLANAAERKRLREAADFFARRSVEQGGLRRRAVLLRKAVGAVAGGLAWSVPAYVVVELSGGSSTDARVSALSGLIPGALFGYATLEERVVRWIMRRRARKIVPLLEDQPLRCPRPEREHTDESRGSDGGS